MDEKRGIVREKDGKTEGWEERRKGNRRKNGKRERERE